MPSFSLRSRRDPWWELDGPAARRARRRERAVAVAAFLAAVIAVGATAVAWLIQLGIAALFGVRATLPLG